MGKPRFARSLAEEVVQDTWMAIVTGIERFEGRSALGTWMFSILTNQAKTHSARERRALPFASVAPADVEEAVVDPDRFQKDDEAWPGHWATPPRPWQKPEAPGCRSRRASTSRRRWPSYRNANA
jgi:RNA polymerase sigma-70 factor (ECF subfamily)